MTRREASLANDSLLGGESFGVLGAAHELKSPTALIRQLALELRDTCENESDRLLIDQIVLTAERSLRLTSNLTKTARLEGGLFELEPINPQQLCEEVAHEMTPLYAAHHREIQVRIRRQAPLVIANRELLRRVLLSFADNALHYGGASKPVSLDVRRHDSLVQIGVRDQGPIVTRDMRGGVVTGRPDASGLGLLIAERFAEVMRASIGTTRHRDGMTYHVTMPLSEQLSLL